MLVPGLWPLRQVTVAGEATVGQPTAVGALGVWLPSVLPSQAGMSPDAMSRMTEQWRAILSPYSAKNPRAEAASLVCVVRLTGGCETALCFTSPCSVRRTTLHLSALPGA
jgi:hypothetical protein